MSLVDVDVFSSRFLIISGYVRDLQLEAEAVHEITTVFPLLFLLGRARREEALEQNKCSALRYGPSSNIHLSNTATSERGSKRFAVATGACGVAIGRGKAWILGRAGATGKNPPASERMGPGAEPGQGAPGQGGWAAAPGQGGGAAACIQGSEIEAAPGH